MQLCINSEKVIEAAKKCTRARVILQELFPQAFINHGFKALVIDGSSGIFDIYRSREAGFHFSGFMQLRSDCEYAWQAFYVDNQHPAELSWLLLRDSLGALCFLPQRGRGMALTNIDSFFHLKALALDDSMRVFPQRALDVITEGNTEDFFIKIRSEGEFKNHAFHLNDRFHKWELKIDSNDTLCLIPFKI